MTGSGSPRSDSANSKSKIISILQNVEDSKWKVITPNINNNISWYDFICMDNRTQQKYYCDIKISGCSSYDNMNAKKAIYWLLTGNQNTAKVPNQSKVFFESMKKNEDLKERDFYYLVVNKNKIEDVYIVSLRNISSNAVRESHNNPPFQAHWGKCRAQSVTRTMQEAKDYFLKKWANVINKNIEILSGGMRIYYPEYFN